MRSVPIAMVLERFLADTPGCVFRRGRVRIDGRMFAPLLSFFPRSFPIADTCICHYVSFADAGCPVGAWAVRARLR
jgi:hypothetical protein